MYTSILHWSFQLCSHIHPKSFDAGLIHRGWPMKQAGKRLCVIVLWQGHWTKPAASPWRPLLQDNYSKNNSNLRSSGNVGHTWATETNHHYTDWRPAGNLRNRWTDVGTHPIRQPSYGCRPVGSREQSLTAFTHSGQQCVIGDVSNFHNPYGCSMTDLKIQNWSGNMAQSSTQYTK